MKISSDEQREKKKQKHKKNLSERNARKKSKMRDLNWNKISRGARALWMGWTLGWRA